MDSLGSAVYTLAILRRLETQQPLFQDHLEQTFFNNCVATMSTESSSHTEPSVAKMKTTVLSPPPDEVQLRSSFDGTEDAFVKHFEKLNAAYVKKRDRNANKAQLAAEINAAAQTIRALLPVDFEYPCREHLMDTRNASSRLYLTNVKNLIFMTFFKRQLKVIRFQVLVICTAMESDLQYALTELIMGAVLGAPTPQLDDDFPDGDNNTMRRIAYDVFQTDTIQSIVTGLLSLDEPVDELELFILKQLKLTTLWKKTRGYLTKMVQRSICNNHTVVPDAMYGNQAALSMAQNLLESEPIVALIQRHLQHIPDHEGDTVLDESIVKDSAFAYLAYHHFLYGELEAYRSTLGDMDRKPKLFRILPQLAIKARAITLSPRSLQENLKASVKRLSPNEVLLQDNIDYKSCATDLEIFRQMFITPNTNANQDRITCTITTDGVKTCWHYKDGTITTTRKRKRVEVSEPQVLRPGRDGFQKGHYGYHGRDVLVEYTGANRPNTVVVDPGAKVLMHAICTVPVDALAVENVSGDDEVSKTAYRRLRKNLELQRQGLSEFKLTNKQWKFECKIGWKQRKHEKNNRSVLGDAMVALAETPLRFTTTDYLDHIRSKFHHISAFLTISHMKAPRRWKFETYKAEQLAGETLCKRVQRQVGTGALIVWGAGNFQPGTRGHASAPNKKMQCLLARYFAVVTCNENSTSKISSCCHSTTSRTGAHPDQAADKRRRADVLICDTCSRLLSRDRMAAMNIHTIFKHQVRSGSNELPDWAVKHVY